MVLYLLFSSLLFLVGAFGMFVTKKNIIIILISLEIILLSIIINFIIFSVFLDDFLGQIYGLFVLTMAAAETALGLAILISYYRVRGSVFVDLVSLLKA